jgi:hypothetical protein
MFKLFFVFKLYLIEVEKNNIQKNALREWGGVSVFEG